VEGDPKEREGGNEALEAHRSGSRQSTLLVLGWVPHFWHLSLDHFWILIINPVFNVPVEDLVFKFCCIPDTPQIYVLPFNETQKDRTSSGLASNASTIYDRHAPLPQSYHIQIEMS
jgi:hypothetical protein